MDAESFRSQVHQHLQGASLFLEPQLLVLKRVSEARKLSAGVVRHLKDLAQAISQAPEGMTVLVFEEHDLAVDHPLLLAWKAFSDQGIGKLHRFEVPTERTLATAARVILAPYNQELSPEALSWLHEQYRLLGLIQQPERNKPSWVDERAWWLTQLLESAALRATTSPISLAILQAGQAVFLPVANPFALTKAITELDAKKMRREAHIFMQVAGPSAYFGLWGALEWQLNQPTVRLSPEQVNRVRRYLAEIEICSKLADFEPAWLLSQLIMRVSSGSERSLVPIRALWLRELT